MAVPTEIAPGAGTQMKLAIILFDVRQPLELTGG